MYAIVEFDDNHGGGVCAIPSLWLTPKKKEAFWPPFKDQSKFDKALSQREAVDESSWQLYNVSRIFYETDDILKAKKKAKEAQVSSNLESEEELNRRGNKKRKSKATKKLSQSSDDEDSNDFELSRPPPVKRPSCSSEVHSQIEPIVVQRTELQLQSQDTPRSTNNHDIIRNNFTARTGSTSGISSTQLTITEKLVALVSTIKEQNDQILAWIAKQSINVTVAFGMPDIPYKLPIQTVEELDELNIYLTNNVETFDALRSYLATLGGNTVSSKANRILKHILSDSVSSKFNYYGQRSIKRAFSDLILKDLVITSSFTIYINPCYFV
ncbi:uncharacterized protein LOC116171856 isoform X2 [Photinus pyralis]|uniref:uncharacterized protein LOC116171856 isoform X2 n=1 Tax=Photinus pyralis TaxID=7054 RepID=UPI0012675005|nr:uncharacterized protein LOC116171856 isoform X2 [Photinus pyralis]